MPVLSQGNGNYYQPNYAGGANDGFIAKFDPSTLQNTYCTYYGTIGDDVLTKMATDTTCNTIATGYTNGQMPTIGSPTLYYIQDSLMGGYDGLMLEMNSNQVAFWATCFGSYGNDFGYSVIYPFPHIYILDMVGEGFYNYGKFRIGGTYLNPVCMNPNFCPQVTSNGESNRFFNVEVLTGFPGGGSGGGGGGGCNNYLQFQALIPSKNTCPDQCNGEASIDTANINGCPPFTFLWSNGNQGLADSSLCELYWSRVIDGNGQVRTIYGRFDVLRVTSVGAIAVSYCPYNIATPDWDTIIHIAGGGPPYFIEYRGLSPDECPTTAYFDIHDTAGCILSYSLPWYRYNIGLTAALKLKKGCKLNGLVSVPSEACKLIPDSTKYVIFDGIDTFIVDYGGSSLGDYLLDAVTGHSYWGYLDMGECQIPLDTVYGFAEIDDTIIKVLACTAATGSISIIVQPDTLAIHHIGSYTVYAEVDGIIHTTTFTADTAETIVFNNLQSGEYDVLVWTKDGCDTAKHKVDLFTVQFHFDEPQLFCERTDTLKAIVEGGFAPFNFNWSPPAVNDSQILISTGGNYFLTVTDALGCSVTHSVLISATQKVIIDTVYENLDPCEPNTLFSEAMVVAHAGVPPLYQVWSSGEITNPAQFIPQGNNWVRVTDAVGCSDTFYFNNTKKFPPSVTDTFGNVLCNGDSSGFVTLQISEGYLPYDISWSNGQTSAGITQLTIGTYSVTVTDKKGCSATASQQLTQPSVIQSIISTHYATCIDSDGTAYVFMSGGVSPLTVLWPDGNTDIFRNNLAAGDYAVVVTDANGCSRNDTARIESFSPIVGFVNTSNTVCNGDSNGSASVLLQNAVAPVNYEFANAVDTFYTNPANNLYAETYTVIAIDAHGCKYTGNFFIDQPDSLVALVDTGSGIVCNGESAFVSVYATGGTAPYNGTFNSSFNAGTYPVNISDDNGCTVSTEFSISEPPVMEVADSITQQPDCFHPDGSITFYATGGRPPYTLFDGSGYQYFADSITVSYPAGNYSFSVIDNGGCTKYSGANIIAYQLLEVTINATDISCFGLQDGSATLNINNAVNPVTYDWSNGSHDVSIDSLPAGNYGIQVTDDAGCSASDTFSISEPTELVVTVNTGLGINCNGGSTFVTVFATGGTPPYSGTSNSNMLAGTYPINVTDLRGCAVTGNFSISEPPVFNTSNSIIQPNCTHGSGYVTFYASGGVSPYTVNYGMGSFTFTDSIMQTLLPNQYYYSITDNLGCVQSDSFSINQWYNLNYTLQVQPVRCFGESNGSVNIQMNGGQPPYTYNGTSFDSVLSVNNLITGSYIYAIFDQAGCGINISFLVSQPAPLGIDSMHLLQGLTCYNRSDAAMQIFASGGTLNYTYELTTPQGGNITQPGSVFSNLGQGVYTITVTDSNGCTSIGQFGVSPFQMSNDSVSTDSVTCYGGSNGALRIYSTPSDRNPFTYSLNGGAWQPYNVYYNLAAGDYQVIVSDKNNCRDTLYVSIPQRDSIDSRVWLNGELLPVDSLVLLERNFADFTKMQNQYPWEIVFSPDVERIIDGDTLVRILPREDITYTVTVYQDSACFIQYTGLIALINVPTLPNIITPNNDGFNDTWKIDLDKFPNADVTIFDRWGEIIYESKNYANDWDALYHGKHIADGTYFYILKVPSQGNSVYKGNINVLNSSN